MQMCPDVLGSATRCCAVFVGEALHGIAKITQQMPAVSNLDSVRCTLTNTLGVSTGAIARDYLDPRMATKPLG